MWENKWFVYFLGLNWGSYPQEGAKVKTKYNLVEPLADLSNKANRTKVGEEM